MNNNSIFLLNPGFDANKAAEYNLLLTVNEHSFSYAVIGQQDAEIKALFDIQAVENIDHTLHNCFSNDPFLGLSYHTINASFYARNEVLVPDELYLPDTPDLFKAFFTGKTDGKLYSNDSLNGINALFTIDDVIEQHFETEELQKTEKYHFAVPMLSLAENDGLYINCTASSAYFLLKKDGVVRFQNHFQVANAEEFNYYLLLLINNLEIDPMSTSVYLTGIVNEGDAKYSGLQQYFTSIDFIHPKGFEIDGSIIENFPKHYFSALLALHLCA